MRKEICCLEVNHNIEVSEVYMYCSSGVTFLKLIFAFWENVTRLLQVCDRNFKCF